MTRDKQRLVVLGVATGAVALAGLAVAFWPSSKPSSKSSGPTPTPGPSNNAAIDELLDVTISTREGPDYAWDITVGGWVINRERKVSWTNLGRGSVVRLSMYPLDRPNNVQTFGLEIVEAFPLSGFTIYKGRWVHTPGGLNPGELVAITSSDISSVVKQIARA